MLLSLSGVPDTGSCCAKPPPKQTQPSVVVKAASKARFSLIGEPVGDDENAGCCQQRIDDVRHFPARLLIRIDPFEGIIREALLVLHAVARHQLYPENLRDFRSIIPQYPAECRRYAGFGLLRSTAGPMPCA